MKREFKVEANIGAPQVAYRETITQTAEVDYTHKKQTGGAGQYARVKILFENQKPSNNTIPDFDEELISLHINTKFETF